MKLPRSAVARLATLAVAAACTVGASAAPAFAAGSGALEGPSVPQHGFTPYIDSPSTTMMG